MSDLETALRAARTRHGNGWVQVAPVCTLCTVLDHLEGVERDALAGALASTMSGRALHRALRASGHRIDRATIQQHRNEGHTP